MRLIDADVLRHKAEHCIETTDMFVEMIDDAPTVDAVEVIRCKECVHDDNCRIQDYLWGDDGFCSKGEQK